MQAIKKIAAAAVIATAVSAATFAADYSGDFQIQLGWQGATTTAKAQAGNDVTFQSDAFYIALQNWNLFNFNDSFALGFYEKVDLALGGGGREKVTGISASTNHIRTAYDIFVGPAASIRVGNIAKFQIGAGIGFGGENLAAATGENSLVLYTNINVDDSSSTRGARDESMLVLGVDLQAKFVPRSVVSPLVGFQYIYKINDKYYRRNIFSQNALNTNTRIAAPLISSTYTLYVGISFNWGKR